jgi:hypothetical protein
MAKSLDFYGTNCVYAYEMVMLNNGKVEDHVCQVCRGKGGASGDTYEDVNSPGPCHFGPYVLED